MEGTTPDILNLDSDKAMSLSESGHEKESNKVSGHLDKCDDLDSEEGFKCFVCQDSFPFYRSLKKHMQIHERDKPHTCFICKVSFSTASILKHHITTHLLFNIENPHKCFICEEFFPSISELGKHIQHKHVSSSEQTHSQPHSNLQENNHVSRALSTQPQCFICKFSFQTDRAFKRHIETVHCQSHTQLKPNGTLCVECNLRVKDLKIHNDFFHFKTFTCPRCTSSFEKYSSFLIHMRNLHPSPLPFKKKKDNGNVMGEKEVMYRCKRRKETCLTKNLNNCRKEKKTYKCFLCKGTFLNHCTLLVHMSGHREAKIDSSTCYICHSVFETKEDLESHKQSAHKKECSERFKCPLCNKTFKNKQCVQRHLLYSHTDKKKYSFKCSICGKSFLQQYLLDVHSKIHSGDKPFQCEHCGLSFLRKCSLKSHQEKVHFKIKNIQCSLCDFKCTSFSNLKGHIRKHMKETTFLCSICGASLRGYSAKKYHMTIHNSNDDKIKRRKRKYLKS